MDLVTLFEKFGFPGAVAIVTIYLYIKLDKRSAEERKDTRNEHNKERREWRESSERLHSDTNRAIKDLTEAIRKG